MSAKVIKRRVGRLYTRMLAARVMLNDKLSARNQAALKWQSACADAEVALRMYQAALKDFAGPGGDEMPATLHRKAKR